MLEETVLLVIYNSVFHLGLKLNTNLFEATIPFLYPLKTAENQSFYICSWYRKGHWSEMDLKGFNRKQF